MPASAFVASIACDVGEAVRISSLSDTESASPSTIADLRKLGLEYYRRANRDPSAAIRATIESALSDAKRATTDIGAVACLISPHLHTALMAALQEIKIRAVPIVEIGLQDCSCGAAVWAATALLDGGVAKSHVLLVMAAEQAAGEKRLASGNDRVFSDAIVCSVISNVSGLYNIRANAFLSDPNMHPASGAQLNFGAQLKTSARNLRDVCSRVMTGQPGWNADDLIICTNANSSLFSIVSTLLDVPRWIVYDADLRNFAHTFWCDNFLAVHHAVTLGRMTARRIVLLSWSPIVVSATLLERALS